MESPALSEFDLHLFAEGRHWHIYNVLGAHLGNRRGIEGARFAVWAPNAQAVSVIGDFNDWDSGRHPMAVNKDSGVWSVFIGGVKSGHLYKFSITTRNGHHITKTDPYGQAFEHRPSNAAVVTERGHYAWGDGDWFEHRNRFDWQQSPISVYEVHPGSWRHHGSGRWLTYRELADQLVPYVLETGFTHIELLPITEHPLDESWGYQTTGYYAPTSRYGSPDDLRYLVDLCHQNNIGVILDWVPGHFPDDDFALAEFDGTALYEHEDPRRGRHQDWGTLIYNYGRHEVRNFLIGSALFWLDTFHMDGLRVDAVASMLYLNYSRNEGEWLPNEHGGHENLEAIRFLQDLNRVCQSRFPGVLMMAEESTSWPRVTRPPEIGGLGFNLKWNMGWMHDTLHYLQQDPVYRQYHHDKLTFGLLYAFSENFVLPLSHDEVVHGKSSLIQKMPGDDWQQRASLRLLFSYMFAYPGAKLLFMGGEFGQRQEWSERRELDWYLLQYPEHQGLRKLIQDLNGLYRLYPALHRKSFTGEGFEWIDCHDSTQSVISFLRSAGSPEHGPLVVVANFTPVPRHHYRIGLPAGGNWQEVFNSDSTWYGGSNLGNPLPLQAEPTPWMARPCSVELTLPPLGLVMLRPAP
ncbi:1,4-alpha-glucan branching protein GlgB [Marinobacter nauticus]|uniref:1,4-alpha-glucan branching protein GlgB n=1 Tax=Marinobacter nauticus TaxID=2743 RepID=UPI001C99D369|nr:1,4-alpha-glucan branching protein GlgB [Marinobacter nauticus]MBY5935963.1 1,4-alpha-glucan branching protein GlgB [Marinobacter nauticus]MBY5953192.1 1,4-alpha-glucan branching protein GlgB [Marinobacter nauticus]MBY6006985.1 1,4-alpha-glucan branching protein GlgB [Marinobacter nauticus]